MKHFQLVRILTLLAMCFFIVGALKKPLRDANKLNEAVEETFVRIRGNPPPRVVTADYGLIRADFPIARSMTNLQIDEWIIEQVAWISKPQVTQNDVNSPIGATKETKKVYRPADYGRASVIPIEGGYLMDVKGTGAKKKPKPTGHGTGLLSTGEALREFIMEKLVSAIFERGFRTVACYAVVDLGFDVKQPLFQKYFTNVDLPAGLILRQAHTRSTIHVNASANSFLPVDAGVKIENVLRRYGLTSAGSGFDADHEIINVQGTKNGEMVDFGATVVFPEKQFTKPVFSAAQDQFYLDDVAEEVVARGNKQLMHPSTPEFIQPDASLRIDKFDWVLPQFISSKHPYVDRVRITSESMVKKFRAGRLSREAIDGYVGQVLTPTFDRLGVDSDLRKQPGFFQSCIRKAARLFQ